MEKDNIIRLRIKPDQLDMNWPTYECYLGHLVNIGEMRADIAFDLLATEDLPDPPEAA